VDVEGARDKRMGGLTPKTLSNPQISFCGSLLEAHG